MRKWGLIVAAGTRCRGFVLPYTRSSHGLAMATGDPGVGQQRFAYAYCHGFLSGPASIKGQALRKSLLGVDVELSLLNLNGGDDPGAITCSGAVEAVRAFHLEQKCALDDQGLKLRLVGSSLGGFIVARYAEMYPEEVDRIFMLCPSFGLGTRALKFASEAEMAEWERTGTRVFSLSTGGEASVPWTFVQEARLQPDYPAYACPAAIVHGLQDEVVPVAVTKSLVEERGDLGECTFATFVEDDHALTKPSTMALTAEALADFFELDRREVAEGAEGAAAVDETNERRDQSPPQRSIEVEAKFSAHDVDQVKETVMARGGHFVGEQVFTDVYWDAKGCGLTEIDWWLRIRAGRWELKVPAADVGEGVTAYREVTAPSEIARKLREAGFLGESKTHHPQGSRLDKRVLETAGFEAFASFRTNRLKYRWGVFAVDIDRASGRQVEFGHEVVEIETMSRESNVLSARDSVTALARSLGARREGESGRPVKGKLVEYIIRNCPRQLEVLTRYALRICCHFGSLGRSN
ncbi:unnamed protein product [Ectocarpus fasciculatus]